MSGIQNTLNLLKTFLKGSKYVNIRKSRGKDGKSKTQFVKDVLNNDDFVKTAQGILNEHGSDLNSSALLGALHSHVKDHAKGQVVVRDKPVKIVTKKQVALKKMGKSTTKVGSSKMGISQPTTRITPVIDKPKPKPQKDVHPESIPPWAIDAIKYASGNEKNFKFRDEPEMRAIQEKLINEYNVRDKDETGKFAPIKSMGADPTKFIDNMIKGSTRPSASAVTSKYFGYILSRDGPTFITNPGDPNIPYKTHEVLVTEDMFKSQSVKDLFNQSMNLDKQRQDAKTRKIEQEKQAEHQKNAKLLNDAHYQMWKDMGTKSYEHIYGKGSADKFKSIDPKKDIVGKPASQGEETRYESGSKEPSRTPTTDTPATQKLPDKRDRPQKPKGSDINDWLQGFQDWGNQLAGSTKPQPDKPSGSRTDEKEREKSEEDDRPFEPKPIEDTDGKKKTKEKKKDDDEDDDPKPPPDEDEDEDEDEEDKQPESSIKATKVKKAKKSGYIRPYFLVGGQNILRLTEAERLQEIKDWNLFNFVPGHSYQSADNPLTQLERAQYNFHMSNVYPNPVERVLPPMRRSDVARYQPEMRPVYERQSFFDPNDKEQWRDRGMSHQMSTDDDYYTRQEQEKHLYPDDNQGGAYYENKLGLRYGVFTSLDMDLASK